MAKKISSKNRSAMLRSVQMLLSRSEHLKHIQLEAVADGGVNYKVTSAVFLLTSAAAEYIVVLKQGRISHTPLQMKLFRKTNDAIHYFVITGLDNIPHQTRSSKPKVITAIDKFIDELCGEQIEMFEDPEALPDFEHYKALVPVDYTRILNTVNFVSGVVNLDDLNSRRKDTTVVDIFYKSEQTTIRSLPYKILMFSVSNDKVRDDIYSIAMPRPALDQEFRTLMAHYKHDRHGAFMKLIKDVSARTNIKLNRVDPEIRMRAVICITSPKDEGGDVDSNFTPLKAYEVTDQQDNLDGTTFLTIIDDRGNEVERRSNNFMPIPAPRQRIAA